MKFEIISGQSVGFEGKMIERTEDGVQCLRIDKIVVGTAEDYKLLPFAFALPIVQSYGSFLLNTLVPDIAERTPDGETFYAVMDEDTYGVEVMH